MGDIHGGTRCGAGVRGVTTRWSEGGRERQVSSFITVNAKDTTSRLLEIVYHHFTKSMVCKFKRR